MQIKMFAILFFFISISIIYSQNTNNTSWQYFGQERPGLKPKVFAPGIVSGKSRLHCFPTFSPDLKEVYWMTLPPKIYYSKYEKGEWTKPIEPENFKGIFALSPFISNDNKRIYFSSNLQGGKGSLDIWYIENQDGRYSQPINLGSPVNTNGFEARQTISARGNIYYTGTVTGKRWNRGIVFAKIDNGEYQTPEILDERFNIIDTNAVDYTPFISNDDSFLIFCSNRDNLPEEKCLLYLSFKDANYKWTDPINLSRVIGFTEDSRDPYISPDRKFLFFSSGENIYWLSAQIISELKNNF